MKVKRAIELLKEMNPDAELKLHHRFGETALFILAVAGDNETVWIESEGDIDLKAELYARYERVEHGIMSEEEYFKDLIEIGITPDHVEKYIDSDLAKKMKDFISKNKFNHDNIPHPKQSFRNMDFDYNPPIEEVNH